MAKSIKSDRSTGSTVSDVESCVAELGKLSRGALAEQWRTLYRCNPPKGASRRFLILAVAYQMQMKRYGGLKPAVARRLRKIASGSPAVAKARASAPRPALGIRLIREWNGTTHVVDVLDDGYLWNGARHRSLSAIARSITGTRWSGPRFFGTNPKGGP